MMMINIIQAAPSPPSRLHHLLLARSTSSNNGGRSNDTPPCQHHHQPRRTTTSPHHHPHEQQHHHLLHAFIIKLVAPSFAAQLLHQWQPTAPASSFSATFFVLLTSRSTIATTSYSTFTFTQPHHHQHVATVAPSSFVLFASSTINFTHSSSATPSPQRHHTNGHNHRLLGCNALLLHAMTTTIYA